MDGHLLIVIINPNTYTGFYGTVNECRLDEK